jgi:hypothetical protein
MPQASGRGQGQTAEKKQEYKEHYFAPCNCCKSASISSLGCPEFVDATVKSALADHGAAGGPNQVVSASTSPRWVRSPTQATYPSGRIKSGDRCSHSSHGSDFLALWQPHIERILGDWVSELVFCEPAASVARRLAA